MSLTLEEYLSQSIDDRVAVSSDTTLFSNKDHNSLVYARSLSCWASRIDLSCVSVWNTTSANVGAGTLISPQHILFSNTNTINNGSQIRFVTVTGKTIVRTLASSAQASTSDIMIGYLDQAVTIPFAKVLPPEWTMYTSDNGVGLPLLAVDSQQKALVVDVEDMAGDELTCAIPEDSYRLAVREAFVTDDIGGPIFLVSDYQPILISHILTTGVGTGLMYSNYISAINTAMSDLGGSYQLTQIDLSLL